MAETIDILKQLKIKNNKRNKENFLRSLLKCSKLRGKKVLVWEFQGVAAKVWASLLTSQRPRFLMNLEVKPSGMGVLAPSLLAVEMRLSPSLTMYL